MSEEEQYLKDDQRGYKSALDKILHGAGNTYSYGLQGVRDLVMQRDGQQLLAQGADAKAAQIKASLTQAQRMLVAVRTDKRAVTTKLGHDLRVLRLEIDSLRLDKNELEHQQVIDARKLAETVTRAERAEADLTQARAHNGDLRAHVQRLEEGTYLPRSRQTIRNLRDRIIELEMLNTESEASIRQTQERVEVAEETARQTSQAYLDQCDKVASMQEALDIPAKSGSKTKELRERIRENEADIHSFINRLSDSQQYGAQQALAVRQYKTQVASMQADLEHMAERLTTERRSLSATALENRQYQMQVEQLKGSLASAMQKLERESGPLRAKIIELRHEITRQQGLLGVTHVDHLTNEMEYEVVAATADRVMAGPRTDVETPADADLLRRLRFANRARGKQGEMIHGLRLEVEQLRQLRVKVKKGYLVVAPDTLKEDTGTIATAFTMPKPRTESAVATDRAVAGLLHIDNPLFTVFNTELDSYVAHLKELGYPSGEITLMIIGFGAGWDSGKNRKEEMT